MCIVNFFEHIKHLKQQANHTQVKGLQNLENIKSSYQNAQTCLTLSYSYLYSDTGIVSLTRHKGRRLVLHIKFADSELLARWPWIGTFVVTLRATVNQTSDIEWGKLNLFI